VALIDAFDALQVHLHTLIEEPTILGRPANCTAEDRARAANFASHARYFAARPGTVFGRPLHVGTSFKASIAPSRSLSHRHAGHCPFASDRRPHRLAHHLSKGAERNDGIEGRNPFPWFFGEKAATERSSRRRVIERSEITDLSERRRPRERTIQTRG
jgi:hypothetical protein